MDAQDIYEQHLKSGSAHYVELDESMTFAVYQDIEVTQQRKKKHFSKSLKNFIFQMLYRMEILICLMLVLMLHY